jgi:hypothetical protein
LQALASVRGYFICLMALSVPAVAHAQTKSYVTLGLDAGAATITDAYLAGISDTVSYELRGRIGYDSAGFQPEMIFSYASWNHDAANCGVICSKDETLYSLMGGVRYTLPLWFIQPFAEAAFGVGHNWKTDLRYLVGGGIDVLVHERSIALGIHADMNWFPYTTDRAGGPTDDDWVFLGAGLTIHLE